MHATGRQGHNRCFSLLQQAPRGARGKPPRTTFVPDDPNDWGDGHWPYFADDRWDVFIPDDDQRDPLPEPGDFWIEPDCRALSGVA